MDCTLSAKERASHLISDETAAFAKAGHWSLFVKMREEEIFTYEQSHIIAPAAHCMGLPLVGPDVQGTPTHSDLFAEY
jgi:hypothetical protein